MRKLSFIVFALVLLAACIRNEENDIFFNPDDVTFYATNADLAETKTVLQADGTIQWLPKDEINVFYSEAGSAKFVSDNTEKAAQVAFKGALKDFTYKDGASFWAVYPYRESHTFSGESLTVSLPANQVAVAGSFADDLFVSIARTTNFNLQFYNVCGGIEFSVTEPGVKTVTFKGNGDEPLAGTAKVGFGPDGKPIIQEVTEAATFITLTTPDGSAFQTGQKYYIALWPATLENGYKITLTKEDGTSTVKKYDKSVTVKRAVWGVLENLDKGLSYELRVPDNEIWYTSTDGGIVTPSQDIGVVSNTYTDGKGRMVFDHPLTEIPEYSFTGVQNLETIALPENVSEICPGAFAICIGLESIDIPGVRIIHKDAFLQSGLSGELSFPNGLTEIGGFAFYGCRNLSGKIVFPSTLERMGDYAFYDSSVEQVFFTSTNPPQVYDAVPIARRWVFTLSYVTIFVPEEALETYQTADYWKDYYAVITVEGKKPAECYYSSTDFSRDGEVVILQQATKGRGVDLVFIGDGFVDRDLLPDGKAETRIRHEVEGLFLLEPFKSLRDRFTINFVKAVSTNDVYLSVDSQRKFTHDIEVSGGVQRLFEVDEEEGIRYARMVANPYNQPLFAALIQNWDMGDYQAHCRTNFDENYTFSIVHPFDVDETNIAHEMGGHGIGGLLDEYHWTTAHGGFGHYPESQQIHLDYRWETFGQGANVDWRDTPGSVRWACFLNDPRYTEEGLGVYEGAMNYETGIYRCSLESVMNQGELNDNGRLLANPFWYNAPSREQIYKIVMQLSEGPNWKYDYETFVAFDAPGREQAATKYREWQQTPQP